MTRYYTLCLPAFVVTNKMQIVIYVLTKSNIYVDQFAMRNAIVQYHIMATCLFNKWKHVTHYYF